LSDDFIFEQVCSSNTCLVDIVFIHGLTGSATDTWSVDGSDEFWPPWLNTDLEHVSIYSIGYPASMFAKWARNEMDIFERASNVLEHFAAKGIGSRPIAFVTHSMGGILAKVILRKSKDSEDEDYKSVSESAKLVIFLSTPHTGASLASVAATAPGSSKHVDLLGNKTGFLNDLNDQYRTFANGQPNLDTRVYYEKHRTKGVALVVSRESADPGVANALPTAVDKDHLNICKPKDRDDIIYLGIKRHIGKLVNSVLESSASNRVDILGIDYESQNSGDRRDLLNKLIDADREHEYALANNAQNEFAREFARTGLFTSARNDYERLLSEIETRFVSHIYHPLICKAASDDKVRTAIQSQIFDPISSKKIGETQFSSRTVLSAMYFLTEQCHIRWDSPS
jgi:hypothetical protein